LNEKNPLIYIISPFCLKLRGKCKINISSENHLKGPGLLIRILAVRLQYVLGLFSPGVSVEIEYEIVFS
jgi:hypothetical protein